MIREAPADTPDLARVSLASAATEAPNITERLPSLTGVLREDAQHSPGPASTPTVLPPSEASPAPVAAAAE
eukprot:1760851-Alexandrium_andersonii.AAC.1